MRTRFILLPLLFFLFINIASAIDYYIPTNYTTISECLIAQNASSNYCIINQTGANNINGTYSFYGVGVILNVDGITFDCNDSLFKESVPGLIALQVYGSSSIIRNCNFDTGGRHIRSYGIIYNNSYSNIYSTGLTDDNYFNDGNSTFENITFDTASFNTGLNFNNNLLNDIDIINCDRRSEVNGGCLHIIGNNNDITSVNLNITIQDIPILDGVLFVSGDNNNISNVDIDGYDSATYYYDCIYVQSGGDGNYFYDINAENCKRGIYLNSKDSIVENAVIDNANTGGVLANYRNYLSDVIISNIEGYGVYLNTGIDSDGSTLEDFYIFNTTGEGIYIRSDSGSYDNITLNGTGKSTVLHKFLKSFSPKRHNGINYNATLPEIFTSDFLTNVIINENQEDVSLVATGLNNFSLWLIDLPLVGFDNETKYMEEIPSLDCPTAAAFYGGTCRFNYSNYLIANGNTSDYTVADISGSGVTVISGYESPPYLVYSIENVQDNPPVYIDSSAEGNDLSNIRFYDSIYGEQFKSLIIEGDNNRLWKNLFLYGGVNDSGSGNLFCYNNLGNFYEESLTPPTGDCGQAAFITPSGRTGTDSPISLYVSWNPQDVDNNRPVNYDVFFQGNYLTTTAANAFIYHNNSLLIDTNYNFEIVPYISGSRFNGTNTNSTFMLYWNGKEGACMEIKDYVGTSFIFFTIVGLLNFFVILFIILSARSGSMDGKTIMSMFIIAVVFNIILIAGYYTFIKLGVVVC